MREPAQSVMWDGVDPEPPVIEPGPDLLPHDFIDYAKASRHARRLLRLEVGEFARLLGVEVYEITRVEAGHLPHPALRTLIYLCTRNPLTVRASLRWPTGPDFLPREVRRA